MIRFYSPDIATTATLPESDSQHAVRVLRLREGSEIEVIDGKGKVYTCRITLAHPKRTQVEIIHTAELPKVWQGNITIAIAPTKHNDRMEWLIEKLTEIGIDRIVPLRCRYSERKEINEERLRKIAVSAMKQSLKATLPQIEAIMPFASFISEEALRPTMKYVAYCAPEIPRRLFARQYVSGRDTTILIGPEGDFSHEEITAAIDAGFAPISLGDNRLRTETAALVACDTCHILQQLHTPASE